MALDCHCVRHSVVGRVVFVVVAVVELAAVDRVVRVALGLVVGYRMTD